MSARVRVLIVDDSLLFRMTLREALVRIEDVEVVDSAANGHEALDKVAALDPDLLTLDVQMPGMDGIEVLRQIRQRGLRSTAIMVSAFTTAGAAATTEALLAGAFDFVLKPSSGDPRENLAMLRTELREKIDAFRQSHRPGRAGAVTRESQPRIASARLPGQTTPRIVVIGCSTGGPEALRAIIPRLPEDLPVPVLIVQHMPPQFTAALASGLDSISRVRVLEAQRGLELRDGTVLLAPGGTHMRVRGPDRRASIETSDDPPEHGCRPAVDFLLRSVADVFGDAVLAVILTGMGRDGQEGCRAVKQRGGTVWTQDEASSVVFGMPRSVQQAGLSDAVLSLESIPEALAERFQQ